MADSNESIADVLAEMRADEIETEDGVVRLDDYADRIEAAVRRAHGNVAAMRDALEWVAEFVELGVDDEYGVDGQNLTVAAEKARAALSAPARNCDRFKTLDEAREAFQDLRGHKILADVELWDSMDEAGALVRWLFAPAQGGAKCVNGLRGEPDCRGCNEHCEDVRKRNCFYWNPDIEGGVCSLTGKKSCPISCDNFHVSKEEKPDQAKGGAE